ncbi:MAG: UDP-N-acetylmuramoyl-tripeptide--D-alanyl-D-alanine ligase [Candidatus Anammoxibacter sp.]
MEQLSLNEIVNAISGAFSGKIEESAIRNPQSENIFNGVSTDSRTTKEGDLFFALKGPNYDGHRFVNDAIKNGAKGAVLDLGFEIADFGLGEEESQIPNPQSQILNRLIRVSDTTMALGDLAKYYREKMSAKIVAITGSNGKTTTKDMVYHLLSKKFKAIKSKASFNNFIGVPLTIFDLSCRDKFGIVEVGANAFGEIKRLSEIASPDVAVITNIGETHLEGLNNVDGVKRAKAEILQNIKDDGLLLVNSDNKFTMEIGKDFNGEVVEFGCDANAKFRVSEINRTFQGWSFVVNSTHKVNLPVPGYHNIFNCVAAIAVVSSLGIEIEGVDNAFNDFRLSPLRMEKQTIILSGKEQHVQEGSDVFSLVEDARITVINDAYNANPSSMRAVVHDLGTMQCEGRKIFVSGDMLELGIESERLHFELGKEIGRSEIDILWAVGKKAGSVTNGAIEEGMPQENILNFEVLDDLFNIAVPTLRENDLVLVKGSRAMELEKVGVGIKSYFKENRPLLVG